MFIPQLVIVLFVIFAWSRAYLAFKKSKITVYEFIFWCVVWLSVIVVIVIPNLATRLAALFGISRGVDLFIYVGILLLFYLIYRIYVRLENMRMDVTKVVREVSILKQKKRKL